MSTTVSCPLQQANTRVLDDHGNISHGIQLADELWIPPFFSGGNSTSGFREKSLLLFQEDAANLRLASMLLRRIVQPRLQNVGLNILATSSIAEARAHIAHADVIIAEGFFPDSAEADLMALVPENAAVLITTAWALDCQVQQIHEVLIGRYYHILIKPYGAMEFTDLSEQLCKI